MQVAIVVHASPYPFLDSKSKYKPSARHAADSLEAAGFRFRMGTVEADAEPPKPSAVAGRRKPKRSHSAVGVERVLQVFDSGASSSRVPRQRRQQLAASPIEVASLEQPQLAAIPIELASLEQPPSQELPQLAAKPMDFLAMMAAAGT
jgi:hypothetical protein